MQGKEETVDNVTSNETGARVSGTQLPELLAGIPATALRIIRDPGAFYREMPREGGYLGPLLFMVALALVAGLLGSLLSLVGLGGGSVLAGAAAIILIPIAVTIFGFVAAGIFFVIWKAMGSAQSFETAYRCLAYSSAILPITTLLGTVPYLGGIAGIAWSTYLLVTASKEVHRLRTRTAWIVFGVVGALLALGSLSTEIAGRRFQHGMSEWQQKLDSKKVEEMTPAEAGKALGDFLKGMDQSLDKKP